ncbi:MAG: hypothetical protein ACK4ND_16730 [Cytophagaceae bacterium]
MTQRFVRISSFLFFTFILFHNTHAQKSSLDSLVKNPPRVGAYFGVVTSLYEHSFDENRGSLLPLNSAGFPVGVNFWLNKKIAFSIEVVPFLQINDPIRAEGLLIHPGFIYNISSKSSLSGRLAFESNGQIGITPIFAHNIYQLEQSALFLAIPFPIRFGNNMPPNFAAGLVIGWGF